MQKILIFGLGYTGARIAKVLQKQGWAVVGTVRSSEKINKLMSEGLNPILFDEAFGEISTSTHILCTVPPGDGGDPTLSVYASVIRKCKFKWVGYLSTTGVYGDLKGAEANEGTPTNPTNIRSKRRVEAEYFWQKLVPSTHVFRLPGIYGPGRSVIDRIKANQMSFTDKPGHRFSRIHVDDIVGAIIASISKPTAGAVYNVVDDLPSEAGDLFRFAAELLGKPQPQPVPFAEADLTPMARSFYSDNRTVSNALIKQVLNYKLQYPTYREGLRAIIDSYSAG
jgi:nucleoside-diphosphate-sugar epimerase